jgi:peroxiredoxin Q/BCP
MAARNAMPEPGAPAPEFCLPDADGREVCLADQRGKWVVLYFYPKDETPGCTKEACAFSEKLEEFRGLDAVVLGVSTDPPASHRKFADRHHLAFPLLSDPEHEVIERYGAWGPKKFMGREFLGTSRATFLIDPLGVIVHHWPAVQVWGHADEVRAKLAELRG